MVKNLPGNARDAGSMGQEDSLEEDMTTHSSILAWKIPWIEEPAGLQFMGSTELDTTEPLRTHAQVTDFFCARRGSAT